MSLFKNNEWKPFPKQAEFLSIPLDVKEAMYGGGVNTAKTETIVVFPIVHKLIDNPRFKMVIMRRTHPELKREVLPRAKRMYRPFGATFNGQDMAFTFPSGAMVFLGHCENEDDVHKYDSMEINVFAPDEVSSLTEYQYLYLAFERVRAPLGSGLPAIIRCAGMPGGIGHCVNEGEVLTPNGWVDISKLEIGSSVYEVNDKFELELSQIEQVHKHEYDGNLWKAHTTNLDISCTPEHRVMRLLGKRGRDHNFTLTPVKDLPFQANICRSAKFSGENPSYFEIPDYDGRLRNEQPSILPYNLYAEFMGWFLSEGFTIDRDKCFGIAQNKILTRLNLQQCLDRCGFKYSENDNQFIIYSVAWYNYLKQFGKSREKFIPRDLLNSSSEALQLMFISLMYGDGHWVKAGESGQYYTISKQLADDFSELSFKLGFSTKLKTRQRENRDGLSYEIYFHKQFTSEILTKENKRACNVSYEPFSGTVYDIGVPRYHNFVIRQKGSIWISGNSWVKKRFIDPAPDGGKIIIGRGGNERIYVHATAVDNPYTDPSYLQSLDALPEAERQARKFGNWNAYLGQVFDEFRDKHYPDEPDNALHVIEPFDIPTYWPKVIAMDWGFNPPAMTCVLYGAVSPDGRVIVYREHTFQKTKIEVWCAEVKPFIDEANPKVVMLCQSAAQDRGQQHTIHQQISSALDRPLSLSGNTSGSRIAGKMLFHEYLRWKPKKVNPVALQPYDHQFAEWLVRNGSMQEYYSYVKQYEPPKEENNLPKLLIFNTCTKFIEAIKMCVYEKATEGRTPEDVAEFPGDDPYDAGRYLLDVVDRYVNESGKELDRVQTQEKIISEFNRTGDYNFLFRNAHIIDGKKRKQFGVSRYHHVR